MYKIRHIPTGKFVKKNSSMGWTAIILNSVLTENNPNNYELCWALTSGFGHTYNTMRGVEDFMSMLSSRIKDQFEVVKYIVKE